VLGSGSSGNATLVEAGATRVLIDAGLGPRSLAERLEAVGVDPASLTAILLSHEHSDHAQGAPSFSAKWGVPLGGSRGTYAAAGLGSYTLPNYIVLQAGETLSIEDLEVRSVRIPHDAAQALAFVLSCGSASLGHATDLGHINAQLVEAFAPCSAILIESNYDPGLLRDGPYPWSLKERILSPLGHLSNGDVSRYLTSLGEECETVVLAHLSQKNNHPDIARMVAERELERSGRGDVRVEITGPDGTEWISVRPGRGQLKLF
jgi:phosphoribosyl 1,2-cyclic phosphodiesterase